jgi:hypothetical protein
MPYCPNCTRIAREKLAACFGELIELAMMVKAAAPYVHARKAPEYSKREDGSADVLCAPRSRGAGIMAYPEITYKDFAPLARNRGQTAESLAERFRGMIEEPREFFELIMTCKYKHEDRSYVVIPYRSVIEFYLEELHYFGESHAKHKRCACGCGAPVFDRKKWASSACKKRIQRAAERQAA